jgi:hypothetical protein
MRSGGSSEVDDGVTDFHGGTRASAAGECPAGEHTLTRRQTLLWLDEQLYPGMPYHHVVLQIRLRGALDVPRLRAAYRDTLLSFDQFRLVYTVREGAPSQRFSAHLNVELPLVDLSQEPGQLETWVARRASAPFDFERALFDAALVRLSSCEHVLYFCQHHIISDGTSAGFFVADLALRYRGEPAPERPSFAHYLRHEQTYQHSQRAARDTAYFDKRLEHAVHRAHARGCRARAQ